MALEQQCKKVACDMAKANLKANLLLPRRRTAAQHCVTAGPKAMGRRLAWSPAPAKWFGEGHPRKLIFQFGDAMKRPTVP
jgi:hypothetical protein